MTYYSSYLLLLIILLLYYCRGSSNIIIIIIVKEGPSEKAALNLKPPEWRGASYGLSQENSLFRQWNSKYKGPNSGKSLSGPSRQRTGMTELSEQGESASDEFGEVGRWGPWRSAYGFQILFCVNAQPSKGLKQGSDMIWFSKNTGYCVENVLEVGKLF